jgi:hypothetical protein
MVMAMVGKHDLGCSAACSPNIPLARAAQAIGHPPPPPAHTHTRTWVMTTVRGRFELTLGMACIFFAISCRSSVCTVQYSTGKGDER